MCVSSLRKNSNVFSQRLTRVASLPIILFSAVVMMAAAPAQAGHNNYAANSCSSSNRSISVTHRGIDFGIDFGRSSRDRHVDRRDVGRGHGHSHGHDSCYIQREIERGRCLGQRQGWNYGYQDGYRGRRFCDRSPVCLSGRSSYFRRAYYSAYKCSYRSGFDKGRYDYRGCR